MEKQQEILFNIVSESRNNSHRNSYPPAGSLPLGSQMDPLLKLTIEQKLGNPSAFRPSKPPTTLSQNPASQVSPAAVQPQNTLNGLQMGSLADNNMSLAQILSELYSGNLAKHL